MKVPECYDTDYGVKDRSGDGCEAYNSEPSACGEFDDDDFTASTMCCACIARSVNPDSS